MKQFILDVFLLGHGKILYLLYLLFEVMVFISQFLYLCVQRLMSSFELSDGPFQIFNVASLLVVLFYELLNFDQESGYLVIEFKDLFL